MLHIASPQGEVVPEQLHDQSRVLVRFLGQRVELSNSVVERCLSQTACAFRRVKDLVVEHCIDGRKDSSLKITPRKPSGSTRSGGTRKSSDAEKCVGHTTHSGYTPEKFSARPSLIGWVGASSEVATSEAFL